MSPLDWHKAQTTRRLLAHRKQRGGNQQRDQGNCENQKHQRKQFSRILCMGHQFRRSPGFFLFFCFLFLVYLVFWVSLVFVGFFGFFLVSLLFFIICWFLWCFLRLWFSWCFSKCIWPFVVGVCKGCTTFVTLNCIWCVWEHVKHAKKRTPRVARSVYIYIYIHIYIYACVCVCTG